MTSLLPTVFINVPHSARFVPRSKRDHRAMVRNLAVLKGNPEKFCQSQLTLDASVTCRFLTISFPK